MEGVHGSIQENGKEMVLEHRSGVAMRLSNFRRIFRRQRIRLGRFLSPSILLYIIIQRPRKLRGAVNVNPPFHGHESIVTWTSRKKDRVSDPQLVYQREAAAITRDQKNCIAHETGLLRHLVPAGPRRVEAFWAFAVPCRRRSICPFPLDITITQHLQRLGNGKS